MSEMLLGLMQNEFPLTLNHIRRRMKSANDGSEVVTLLPDGSAQRISHAALTERVDRLARALRELGVEPLSVGRSIVATWHPQETIVLEAINALGLDLQITFNKGAVMVLGAGVNKVHDV